jgi:hypothetical protein
MSGDLYRQPERIGVRVFNIDAALVGTTNTAIVRWESAPVTEGDWPLASFATYTSTAAAGSSFKFTSAMSRWRSNRTTSTRTPSTSRCRATRQT